MFICNIKLLQLIKIDFIVKQYIDFLKEFQNCD